MADVMLTRGGPEHIRSDNGAEMTAKIVRGWFAKIGVKTTGEYCSISVGVAEKRSLWKMLTRENPAISGPFSQRTEKLSESYSEWLATQC